MLVPELLLETLEGLVNDDFQTFKWYLTMNILDSCKPIAKSRLEKACRTETVSRMTENYGEASAVNITVEILKKMNISDAADRLKNTYTGTVTEEFLKLTC